MEDNYSYIKSLARDVKKHPLIHLFFLAAWLGVTVSYSKLYLFHIIALLILGTSMASFLKKPSIAELKTRLNKHLYFFPISLGWFCLTLVWASDPGSGFKSIFYLLNGYLIVFVVALYVNSVDRIKNFITITFIVIMIELIICVLEVFTSFRLPISRNSFLLPMFDRSIVLTSEALAQNDWKYLMSMPTGFHFNPNDLSTALCIVFPFLLLSRIGWIKHSMPFVIVFLVVASGARIAFLALSVIYLVYFIFYADKRKWIVYLVGLSLLFVHTDGFYYFSTHHPKVEELAFLNKKHAVLESGHVIGGGVKSVTERKKLIVKGFEMFKEHPVRGVGIGNSKEILRSQGGVGRGKLIDLHFYWLEILAEGGLIYMLLFSAWVVSIMVRLYKRSILAENKIVRYASSSLLLAFFGFGLASIGPSSVVYFYPMYLLFGASIALIYLKEDHLNN